MRFANLRRVIGRSPQSVTDYDADINSAEVAMPEIHGVPEQATPTLPINVAGVTGFQNLPDELLEQIFLKLSGSSRKNYFAVSGVSRAWRRLGNKMFFASPWDTPHLICHPNQLFCLSPRSPTGSRSGLLKCFVRRDPAVHTLPDGRTGRKISFFLGKDPLNTNRARFLLTAVQPSRHQILIFLNSKCEGPPCARLTSNVLCTSYTLENGMSFFLEGPNVTASTRNGGSPVVNRSSDAMAESTTTTVGTASVIVDDGSISGVSSSSPVIPPLLMSLRYRARVRGLMQPRRMDAALPNPSFMACGGTLPKMQKRPSLGYISSVAALERPPAASTSKEEEESLKERAPAGGGAGPSSNSSEPSNSVSTSLATSPENIVPLGEQSNVEAQAASAPSSGAVAAAAVPTIVAAALEPLWKRVFGAFRGHRRISFSLNSLIGSNNRGGSGRRRGVTFDESALPVCLVNKSPHWNEALRCWCLNFRGRVKLASVKNFQLVKDGDEEAKVSMQFGKFDKDLFILDFNPMTLSAIQAFAIALTTFDSKVTL